MNAHEPVPHAGALRLPAMERPPRRHRRRRAATATRRWLPRVQRPRSRPGAPPAQLRPVLRLVAV